MMRTVSGQLAPLNDEEASLLSKVKTGHVVEVDVIQKRNPMFLRKFFALIKIGFEVWTDSSPHTVEYHGQRVLPNLERFRKDIQILAGFYEPVYNLKGELRLEARSISFASMSEDDFEQLYSAVIDVLLRNVLANTGYDEKTLREHVDRVLAFD